MTLIPTTSIIRLALFLSVLTVISSTTVFADNKNKESENSSQESNKKEDEIEKHAQKCIVDGTKIVSLNDRTINLTNTFNHCYHGKDSGKPLVWFFIGHMQLNGIGASTNFKEGLKFLEKAGLSSIPAAQKELADYYLTGGGIKNKVNMPKALDWLSRLALNKDAEYSPEATFRLCSIYLFGTGVQTDYARALTWCRKSGLEQHNYDGLTNLALMYINGLGIKKDASLAIDYYTTAAKHGVISAQLSLGRAYSLGTDIPADYKLAFKWMAEASQGGSSLAMFYLAQMYEFGQGITQDKDAAFKLYKKSAELGEPQAQYTLGHIYQYGDNPNLDYAAKWYHKSAAQNNSDAMIAIGDLYVSQNQKEMMKWYKKAAALNNPDGALRQIPYLLSGTADFRPKTSEALSIAEELAEKNIDAGHYWLGIIYKDGLAGKRDLEKAQYELSQAAHNGYSDAALELGIGCIQDSFPICQENDAENFLRQASLNGCIKNSCFLLGQLYIKENLLDEAIRILKQDDENPNLEIRNASKQLLETIINK